MFIQSVKKSFPEQPFLDMVHSFFVRTWKREDVALLQLILMNGRKVKWLNSYKCAKISQRDLFVCFFQITARKLVVPRLFAVELTCQRALALVITVPQDGHNDVFEVSAAGYPAVQRRQDGAASSTASKTGGGEHQRSDVVFVIARVRRHLYSVTVRNNKRRTLQQNSPLFCLGTNVWFVFLSETRRQSL